MMKDPKNPDYDRIEIAVEQIIDASNVLFEEFRKLTPEEIIFVDKAKDMIVLTTYNAKGNTNLAMTTLTVTLLREQVNSLKKMLAERKRRSDAYI